MALTINLMEDGGNIFTLESSRLLSSPKSFETFIFFRKEICLWLLSVGIGV